MRLYKYRDLSKETEVAVHFLEEIIRTCSFWCGKPEKLNDPNEFFWARDYSVTLDTAPLLAQFLMSNGTSCNNAYLVAMKIIYQQQPASIEKFIEPFGEGLINKCRDEVGVACFATDDSDRELMWSRYGGSHFGVCVELEMPDTLLDTHLYKVNYTDKKVLHIDRLLRTLNRENVKDLYDITFLTKEKTSKDTHDNIQDWSLEAEIRFVSKTPNVSVWINDSRITGVYFGHKLPKSIKDYILDLLQRYTVPKY